MNRSYKYMTSIEVGAGTVTITDETIQIDIGPFGALKRFHEQSKLIIPFLIFGIVLTLHTSVLDSSPLRELGRFAIIFVIAGFTLGSLLPRIRNNIGTATEIRRTDVERVEYTTGSRLLARRLRIIVAAETTGVRPVPLAYRQLGEQQLSNAIQTFEDTGITVVPADNTTDGNS